MRRRRSLIGLPLAALLLGACATAAPLPDPPAKPSKMGVTIAGVLQAVLGASNPRRGAPRQALPSKPGEQRIAVDAKLMRDEELSQLLAEFQKTLADGDREAAFNATFHRLRWQEDREGILYGGLRREDYIESLEVVGRAMELAGDLDRMGLVYGQAEFAFRHFEKHGWVAPRVKARLLTAKAITKLMWSTEVKAYGRTGEKEKGVARESAEAALALLDSVEDATPLELGRARWSHGMSRSTLETLQDTIAEVEAGVELVASVVPEGHPELKTPLSHLMFSNSKLQRWKKTTVFGKRLLALYMGEDPLKVARIGKVEIFLTVPLAKTGDLRGARATLERGLARLREHLPHDGLPWASGLIFGAHGYIRIGDLKRAKRLHGELTKFLESRRSKRPTRLDLDALNLEGRLLRAQGRRKQAVKIFERLVLMTPVMAWSDSWRMARGHFMLFVLHHELGNEEAAQKHKKLGLPHAKRAYPAGSPIWESWRTGKWKER